jgi:hypothetical protein
MRLAEESGCVAEQGRGLGCVRVCVRGGRFDVGSNPLWDDHGADQRLYGYVSRFCFELQLPIVFVPH